MSTNQCKISANGLLLSSWKWLHDSDSEPSQRSTHAVTFCRQMFLTSVSHKTTSTDLSPGDYSISGSLQQLVYHQKIKDSDHLTQVPNSWLDMFSQELIKDAVDQGSKCSAKNRSMVLLTGGLNVQPRTDQQCC